VLDRGGPGLLFDLGGGGNSVGSLEVRKARLSRRTKEFTAFANRGGLSIRKKRRGPNPTSWGDASWRETDVRDRGESCAKRGKGKVSVTFSARETFAISSPSFSLGDQGSGTNGFRNSPVEENPFPLGKVYER